MAGTTPTGAPNRAALVDLEFIAPEVDVERRDDGTIILSSPRELLDYDRHVGEMLRRAASQSPDTVFLAERPDSASTAGGWRTVTYGEMRRRADAIAQSLLDRGFDQTRPVMILSANSIDHATLTLGAMQAGVPAAPVSVAYSLMSTDHAKIAHIRDLVEPAMVYADDGAKFTAALAVAAANGAEVVVGKNPPGDVEATLFEDLLATTPSDAVEQAFAAVGPDTIAKYLFTSGSTGQPKGVINLQRMLCANQQMIAQIRPPNAEDPPTLLDWLPWNHTYGGNYNVNFVIRNQGTMYIDTGRPLPGLFDLTIGNLREVSPTVYFGVPAGYAMLIPLLEHDPELCESFFRNLKLAGYGGASLPDDLWQRLTALSVKTTGKRVMLLTGWGSTETAPTATSLYWEVDRPGVIGLPLPGIQIKMVPAGTKMELRIKGPIVFPGYLKQPDLTAQAFDDEGYYKIGDAGRLEDPDDATKGIRFDGRVVEDFKLETGTWVHVGSLRVAAIEAASPVVQDALVAGHDRADIGLLAWPNIAACRQLAGDAEQQLPVEQLIRDDRVVAALRAGLAAHNERQKGSSTRIGRAMFLADAPSFDAGEITDMGYINQITGLDRRAADVEALYAGKPGDGVLLI
ncbi:MAG: feruloyl-CoA synthase [Alphaproteobacteria bacterium]